ncbi:MAG: SDR family oxidoreductase [Bacteroidota bacterium]
MKNLKGKIGLVTGGSRGLGRDMVLRLAENGSDVIFTYHSNETAAQEVIASVEELGQKAVALQLDQRKVSSFEAFAGGLQETLNAHTENGKMDFLVTNAGTGGYNPIGQVAEEQFDDLMQIHFKGVVFLIEHLLPLLDDGGRIINISTGLTRFVFPGYGPYAAMKGAMEVYTKYLAKELGGRKITANLVAPGAIYTDFNKGAFDANPQVVEMIGSLTALGRVGQAEDIGGVVAFLASDDAGWINAQRIEVSGGQNL